MKFSLQKGSGPFYATLFVFALLYAGAALHFPGFAAPGVFVDFFSDNAFLGVAAVGITFVLLSGGIDLSVGAMIGFTSIVVAVLIGKHGVNPFVAIAVALALGTLLGAAMGALIRYFALPPFLVTLAGMFFARGMGFVISVESLSINHPVYTVLSEWKLNLGAVQIPLTALILLAAVAIASYIAKYTRFGRNVYALGGNTEAANLMGLPVGPTQVRIYAFSGFCSALAGVVYSIYSASGNPSAGSGLELDAIAATVIGGTLLTGGVGGVPGTLVGVLIFGIIQTGITFQGNLSSWWTKIAVGLLLLLFVLLQKFFMRGAAKA
ncbi:MAG TPA: galactofuranose ABC transporter, permease protein YjfF [Armatimonadota bacterium]